MPFLKFDQIMISLLYDVVPTDGITFMNVTWQKLGNKVPK